MMGRVVRTYPLPDITVFVAAAPIVTPVAVDVPRLRFMAESTRPEMKMF